MTVKSGFDFHNLIARARQVVFDPHGYYAGMPKQGGYAEPLIYATVMGLVAGIIGAILSGFTLGSDGGVQIGMAAIIVMPIAAVIGSFVFTFIMWVVWKLMGSRENYETAYRAVSATMVVLPFSAVIGLLPYFGTLVINVWFIWLMILASIHVHGLERKKSMTVIGILGAVLLLVNLSGEHSQRVMNERYSDLSERMREFQKLTPEEQKEITAEFLRGIEEGPRQEQEEN